MRRYLLGAVLAASCAAGLPYARVSGTTLTVHNPTGRHAIAKVECNDRVFDGEYDRYFVLTPYGEKVVSLPTHFHGNPLHCIVGAFEYKTPAEVALEVVPGRRR
jgi:hypothetical protein